MKRELKRQRTLQLIMNTTREVITEKGCALTTINDIIERSGLSKGAIFHYVKNKEHLMALVLEEHMQDVNRRFEQATTQENKEFEGPMREIAARMDLLLDPKDISNQILMYLLSRSDVPEAQDCLTEFYEKSVNMAGAWIGKGQEHQVIPSSVPQMKTAELFILLSLGIRMRSLIAPEHQQFELSDYYKLMVDTLQPEGSKY